MPKRYEKMKVACLQKPGKSEKECKTQAAKIENSLRKKEGKPPAKWHRKKS